MYKLFTMEEHNDEFVIFVTKPSPLTQLWKVTSEQCITGREHTNVISVTKHTPGKLICYDTYKLRIRNKSHTSVKLVINPSLLLLF